MTGLRERRHRETKELLVQVAFELFVDRGFNNVSMDEVANAAGVSRSTVYRRFPTKDDVVLEVPKRWLAAFDQALDTMPVDSSLEDALRIPTMAVSAHIDANRQTVRTAYAILEQSPRLQQSGIATTAWFERMVALVDQFGDVDAEMSMMIAGAYLGGIDAMMQHWASTGGTTSVVASSERLLQRLAPLAVRGLKR